MQDAGSFGHAELLARQAMRALQKEDAMRSMQYMGAAAAQWPGKRFVCLHSSNTEEASLFRYI